jgi:hypothetical protein
VEPLQVSVIGLGVSVTLLGGVVAYLIRRLQRHVVRTREQFERLGTIAREMLAAMRRQNERMEAPQEMGRVLSEEALADIPMETRPTDDELLAHLWGPGDGDPGPPTPTPRTSFERILDDDEG